MVVSPSSLSNKELAEDDRLTPGLAGNGGAGVPRNAGPARVVGRGGGAFLFTGEMGVTPGFDVGRARGEGMVFEST